jgi:hypothetical protein
LSAVWPRSPPRMMRTAVPRRQRNSKLVRFILGGIQPAVTGHGASAAAFRSPPTEARPPSRTCLFEPAGGIRCDFGLP